MAARSGGLASRDSLDHRSGGGGCQQVGRVARRGRCFALPKSGVQRRFACVAPTRGRPYDSGMPLDVFHPIVAGWFADRFGEPTEPQRRGWPEIAAGRNTLIAAPTGSGKTLAAFLVCLDRLLRRWLEGSLDERIHVVYVSPLKALGNDIHRNLEVPLAELAERAAAAGLGQLPIRAAVRTGDTPAAERQAMLRRPPHILVTTPESLYLLLTAARSRELLSAVDTVIVDEIHALARDKRGSHLALSLERLEALCAAAAGADRPVGHAAADRRDCSVSGRAPSASTTRAGPTAQIVDAGHVRELDLAIEVPPSELSAVCSNEQWGEIYARLTELVAAHRSTLVFVNTRRLAERVAHHLRELLGEDAVAAITAACRARFASRPKQRLKAGQLRAIVATASLEMGIDIGYIDLVCQIGSPGSIATFLQRVGRAGHSLGKIPKGRLFPLIARRAARIAGPGAGRARGTSRRGANSRLPAGHSGAADRGQRGLRANGAKTSCTGCAAGRGPIASWRERFRRDRRDAQRGHLASGAARGLPAPRSDRRPAAGAARRRGWRRSLPAARFPRRPFIASSPSPRARSSARSTRTSRSRAWRATCFCWATRRGGCCTCAAARWWCATPRGAAQHPVLAGRTARANRRILGRAVAAARRHRGAAGRRGPEPGGRDRLAGGRVRGAGVCRRAGARLRGHAASGHRAGADRRANRLRAVLRRIGRHATGDPRPAGLADQSGLGAGAAQAVLPQLRFRAASQRRRRRHRALAGAAAQLSHRGTVQDAQRRQRARRCWSRPCWPCRCSRFAGAGT